MKKYTFEDWLNDRIDSLPGGEDVFEILDGLYILYKDYKMIELKDYEQIKKYQLEAFNTAVKIQVESLSWNFLNDYNKTPCKSEYLNNEIRKIEKLVNEDLNKKGYVLAGRKDYLCLKGSEYKRIMEKELLMKKGKLKFYIERFNNNIRITFLNEYLQWLLKLKTDKKTLPVINTLKEACKGPKEFESIKAWFINKGFCHPQTFIWTVKLKGNKLSLISYLKDLHVKGYTIELTNLEIQRIAKNSFGKDISIDWIKRVGPNWNYLIELPPFIS